MSNRNRVVKNMNKEFSNLGEIKFSSQEEILEAHQVMINQLRENVIKLANQNNKLHKMVNKLYVTLEENNIKISNK